MTLIDRINEELTLDEVLSFLPDLTMQGHNYVGNCPSGHDSKSGKCFQVNTMSPTFHCFNCGASGSYIHLIELIKFGTSSAGKGGTDNFIKTLQFLSERYSLEDKSYMKKEDSIFQIIEHAVYDYNNQMLKFAPEILEQCKDQYGFSNEFINSEKWGFGKECPSKRLLEYWSFDEVLSTGLFNKTKKTSTGLFHIYQNRIVIPYNIRGRMVYTIGRRTKLTSTMPNGSEAPKYFKQYINRTEKEYISKSIKNQPIYSNKDNNEIVITEGITDYLAAKMHGLNAVSAVTTSFKREDCDSVVKICKKFKKIYIANDNDKNGAGQKGTDRVCKMLADSGLDCNIVLLPRLDNKDKIDLAEFLRDCGVEEFNKLKLNSVKYIDYLINKVSPDVDKTELINELGDAISAISKQKKELIDVYLNEKIRSRFKLSSMRDLLKAIKDEIYRQRSSNESQKEDKINDIFSENEKDIKLISSGQDYVDGILYYTITRPQQVTDKNGLIKIINKPFIVDSNQKIREIKDYQIIEDGFALNRRLSPDNKFNGWSFKENEYSVFEYVNNNADIRPDILFKKIHGFIDRYIYTQKDYEVTFLAVALMTFPLYMIFNAIGYIQLWAEKRSGKTTVLEIMQLLGFNSMMSSSMTDAAIFRSIEYYRPLLLMDEAENLNPSIKARESMQSEKLELLKSGYKKSGSATRCEGQNNTVMTFHNYSPKVFAGTKTIDSVLADRTIIIEMKRAPEDAVIEELIEVKVKKEAQVIKDMIHCYAMKYAQKIESIYIDRLEECKDVLKKKKVQYRAKELWSPYLSVAFLIDEHDRELKVFESLLNMADNEIETKETFGSDSKSMEIVEQLYIWTKNVQERNVNGMQFLYDGDIYLRKGITDFFIKDILKSDENEDDFHYVNYQNLKQTLRKYNVIDKDCDIKSHRVGSNRGAALNINQERLLRSLITYKNNFDEEVLKDIDRLKVDKDIEDFKFEKEAMD